jgi:hypothetical protein
MSNRRLCPVRLLCDPTIPNIDISPSDAISTMSPSHGFISDGNTRFYAYHTIGSQLLMREKKDTASAFFIDDIMIPLNQEREGRAADGSMTACSKASET